MPRPCSVKSEKYPQLGDLKRFASPRKPHLRRHECATISRVLTVLIIAAALIGICSAVIMFGSGQHRRREQRDRDQCPVCRRAFASVPDLDEHVATHLEVKRPTLAG